MKSASQVLPARFRPAAVVLFLLASGTAMSQDMNSLWQDGAFEVSRQSIKALEPEARRDQVLAMGMTMVRREADWRPAHGRMSGRGPVESRRMDQCGGLAA